MLEPLWAEVTAPNTDDVRIHQFGLPTISVRDHLQLGFKIRVGNASYRFDTRWALF